MAEENKRTSYEAAAAWDACRSRDRGEPPFAGDLLVLDLDRGGAGVCRCAGTGHIELLGETRVEPIPDFFADLGCPWPADPRLDRAMALYLRGKGRVDPPALTLPGGESLSCGAVVRRFEARAGRGLSALLERTGALLESLGTDRTALRILTVGALAAAFPARHRVRTAFSADPFLPDARFVDLEGAGPAEVVRLGLARYAAGEVEPRQTLDHEISLCLLESWGSGMPTLPVEQPLARRDTPLEELAVPAFTEPFYLETGDPVRVKVDGVEYALSPRYPKGLLDGAAQAGLRAEGRRIWLVLDIGAVVKLDVELPIHGGGEEGLHG